MTQREVLDTIRRYRDGKGRHYPIVRLGVFGSAARNRLADNSDVDIVVELEKPDLFALIGIKQDLEELLDRPVDIVRYRQQLNPALKRQIESEALYV
jgi:predicted nucleotidyltransferase